ncbi:MAG: hypothetical protein PHY93_04650 [Bacteriovorax sp.]|nr:hypothetical protein [Bacteriovorax sp.]
MFNNQPFDSWLNKKSDDILSKVDREMITTEEMIILVLKAQTNHFYHTDIDLKKGLSDVDHKIESTSANLEEKIKNIDRKLDISIAHIDHKLDTSIAHFEEKFIFLDKKIDQLDYKTEKRFERVENQIDSLKSDLKRLDIKIDNRFMWMIGITIAMSGGIYLKLFLG